MSLRPEVLAAAEHVAAAATSTWDIGLRLQDAAPATPEEARSYRSLVLAFRFMLIDERNADRRDREGSAFGAAWEMDGQRLPPRLDDIEDSDVTEWAEAAAQLQAPALRARLHDLLWERRSGDKPYEHALAAIAAYVELAADSGWSSMDRTDCLERASEIARQLSAVEQQQHVIAAILMLIEEDLTDESGGGPGIALNLIEALLRVPADQRPTTEAMVTLIDRAHEVYGKDPHIQDTITDLRSEVLPAERDQLRRAQVERWFAEAEVADGILRLAWLERAYELSTNYGLADLAARARVELQNLDPDSLGLKQMSAEVGLPQQEVDKFLEAMLGDGDWRATLARMGGEGPPGGGVEDVEQAVDQQMAEHPLLHLVRKEVGSGPYGTTIFHALSHADHRRLNIAELRALNARIWAVFASDVLDRIPEAHGRPSREDLTEFFTTDLIPAETAERIARAIELYWDDLPDEAAHVLAPRLEAVVRNVAHRAGIPVTNPPKGATPGGVRTLGGILTDLKPVFADEAWLAYINNLLSDPLGLNLRNVIAHALRPQASREDAALLIHVACFLRLLRLGPPESPGDNAAAPDPA